MSTYINRESLIEAMKQTPFTMAECETPEWCRAANWARMNYIKALKMLPSEDVEEVRHGHWSMTEDGAAYCSACKRKMNAYLYGYARCAICGAKMDGLVEEE